MTQMPVVEKFHSHLPLWEIARYISSFSKQFFFLDSVESRPPDQRYSYLGWDPFLTLKIQSCRVELKGAQNGSYPLREFFPILRKLLRRYRYFRPSRKPFFTGGAVGFLGYETAALCDAVSFRRKKEAGVPLLALGFYRDMLVFDHLTKTYYLVTHCGVQTSGRKNQQAFKKAKARLKRLRREFESLPVLKPNFKPFKLKKFTADISRGKFLAMVKKAKEYIRAGDIYQANLSQRFSFSFSGSAMELYSHLRKINPSPFMSFLKMDDLQIVSSSPERLVRKDGQYCQTKPIAGTRPKYGGAASLKIIRKELIQNEKERAEHIMLLDLERNDLGRVCDYRSVCVEKMMELEEYSHVVHIVSTVSGRLKQDKDGVDLIRAMFPGGTITGCPKIRCMEVIDELEPVKSGVYTGSIGYLDFKGNLDLNIIIRTLVLVKNKGYLQVGAGIVADSIPQKEYEETLHKGEALVEALAKASL